MRIDACFDSHVHWPATGEFSGRLKLDSLRKAQDLDSLKIEPAHFRGEWLLGFGWDQNQWADTGPIRLTLDEIFPDKPVAWTRRDGHAYWVNTLALKLAGLWQQQTTDRHEPLGGRIARDGAGWPTGELMDNAMLPIQKLIPALTDFEMRRHLLLAAKAFNQAGFTHIRDMTCNESQWQQALKLEDSGLLTLAVEEFFWLKDESEIDAVIGIAVRARTEQKDLLRVKGVKLFVDGALGSEGAWISKCYHGSIHQGLQLWSREALVQAISSVWQKNLAVAIHAIGDQAVDFICDQVLHCSEQSWFHRLSQSVELNLEHVEILRPETLEKLKAILATKKINIYCHLQPSHWLDDRRWLTEKVGELARHAFPWRRLQEADVSIFFGSDSPIETASVSRTLQALRASAEAGVPKLLGQATSYMSHPDLSWAANSYSVFVEEIPETVVFKGENIL